MTPAPEGVVGAGVLAVQLFWADSEKTLALPYVTAGLPAVTDEEAEELVECFFCSSHQVHDLAYNHDAGWICSYCRDNGGP